jgi:hypothetical protein
MVGNNWYRMAKCYLSTHCGSQRPSLSLYSNSLLFAKMYVSKLLFHPGKHHHTYWTSKKLIAHLTSMNLYPLLWPLQMKFSMWYLILFDCSPNIKPVICHVRTFSSWLGMYNLLWMFLAICTYNLLGLVCVEWQLSRIWFLQQVISTRDERSCWESCSTIQYWEQSILLQYWAAYNGIF